MAGFSPDEANVLLLAALLQPERLAERLLRVATETGITASEREMRLRALRSEEVRLRYDEEAAICAAIERSDGASELPRARVAIGFRDHEVGQSVESRCDAVALGSNISVAAPFVRRCLIPTARDCDSLGIPKSVKL
jgi:hypothetical protein